MHIKFYENKSDSDLTQKLTSISMVCITIDIGFGVVLELFSRENKRIHIDWKNNREQQLLRRRLWSLPLTTHIPPFTR